MKCNPLVSMPIALSLFALAASQVFSTVGKLAMDGESQAAEQAAAVLETRNIQDPPGPLVNAAGRAMAVQQLQILDPAGNPVILLSGTDAGATIEMRTANGDRVMMMQAHETGAFRHEVYSGGEPVGILSTIPDRGTHAMLASPGRHASLNAVLQTQGSTLAAFNTLRMNSRAGLYQWLSLSGAEFEGRDYPPGMLISSMTDLKTRTSLPMSEHSLYSLEELQAAMAEGLPADE
jgi:hypothetical protein